MAVRLSGAPVLPQAVEEACKPVQEVLVVDRRTAKCTDDFLEKSHSALLTVLDHTGGESLTVSGDLGSYLPCT